MTRFYIAKRLLLLAMCLCFPGQASAGKPNIVMIVVDDMGWTGLSSYGSDLHETPHIDRLASAGVRFTNAYAAAPVCSPTRASIMTGKSPARLHITVWHESAGEPPAWMRLKLVPPTTEKNLSQDDFTLAEALRAEGYLTAHIGKWHLGDAANYPENHGFDVNIGGTFWGCPATFFYPYRGPFGGGREMRYVPGLALGKKGEYLTDRLTDEALAIIDGAGDQPFYLNLWYYTVHTPIEGPPDLVDYYRRKIKAKQGDNRNSSLDHDNANYAAMHHRLDENIGRLLARLQERGIAENTIVLLTSDNGGYVNAYKGQKVTSNAPLRSGKGSLYEGGVRVPLIVKWPGKTIAGGVCHEPVITTDFYPTICQMAGVAGDARYNEQIEGQDISPLLLNPAASLDREALYFHYPHYYPTTTPVSAVRAGDWKLLEFHEGSRVELYNLADDPGERRDLAGKRPQEKQRLVKMLHDWRTEVGAQMPSVNPAARK